MYPIHNKPADPFSFERLDKLWDRYPRYHEMTAFTTLEELLSEYEQYREDFEPLREEYESKGYERFLIRLSWADLPWRYATKDRILAGGGIPSGQEPVPGRGEGALSGGV